MTSDTFARELEALINKYSQENASNTPDFILATYLVACLAAWNTAVAKRENWYGRAMLSPGTTSLPPHRFIGEVGDDDPGGPPNVGVDRP